MAATEVAAITQAERASPPDHHRVDSLETVSSDDVMLNTASTVADAAQNVGTAPIDRDFETSDLYKNVYNYVKEYMARYDCSHDFNHILRVLALSKRILAAESRDHPLKKLHKPAIILAALLHDVGDRKYAKPGEDAEQLVTNILTQNGCPPRFAAKVALIVQHVSYSSEIKRPQLVKAMIAAHPELAIVQDADRLDAIGAVGIGRVFAYGAAKAPDRGLEGSVQHFVEKLERLESMMKTQTGKELAAERTRRLQQFRGWWEEETGEASKAEIF